MDVNTNIAAQDADQNDILLHTAEIVASYVGSNTIDANELPGLIKSVHASLTALNTVEVKKEKQKPAVAISRSVTPDYIICLEDGKKLKMLKRHLMAVYGMTPDEYRTKWGLNADYPMTAPNYAKRRSEFAKQIGLGKIAGGRKKAKTAA